MNKLLRAKFENLRQAERIVNKAPAERIERPAARRAADYFYSWRGRKDNRFRRVDHNVKSGVRPS